MINNSLTVRIAAIAALSMTVPLVGLAATPSQLEDITVKVSYADLDIENEAGAKVLYKRLKAASEEVCGVGNHLVLGSLTAAAKARTCYKETLSAAVEKIDSEVLNAIHEG